MRINKARIRTRASAFTIVELLIVIVIIGILAAITIVSYTGISQRTNIATLQSDLANAKKKFEMYYTEHGLYPTVLNSNGCPTSPIADDNYCIKSSNGGSLYIASATGRNYTLVNTINTISYQVTESASPEVAGSVPSLPDADWITIGTQRWAKANLNVGTRIAGTSTQTNNGTIEKYCYGNTDAGCTNTDANGIAYGALYQWDEAMNYSTTEGAQGICPTGSHIPTDAEWKTLEMHLGMTQATADISGTRGTDEGGKLKPGGVSGLNIPLAGYRTNIGSFDVIASNAYLRTSSENSTSAWRRRLEASTTTINRVLSDKTYGFSVRCLGN